MKRKECKRNRFSWNISDFYQNDQEHDDEPENALEFWSCQNHWQIN